MSARTTATHTCHLSAAECRGTDSRGRGSYRQHADERCRSGRLLFIDRIIVTGYGYASITFALEPPVSPTIGPTALSLYYDRIDRRRCRLTMTSCRTCSSIRTSTVTVALQWVVIGAPIVARRDTVLTDALLQWWEATVVPLTCRPHFTSATAAREREPKACVCVW